MNTNCNWFVPLSDILGQTDHLFSSDDARKIIEAQAREHRRWLVKLDSLAHMFLYAANGDRELAERFLDVVVEGLIEPNRVVSMWRYRILLAGIREDVRIGEGVR